MSMMSRWYTHEVKDYRVFHTVETQLLQDSSDSHMTYVLGKRRALVVGPATESSTDVAKAVNVAKIMRRRERQERVRSFGGISQP